MSRKSALTSDIAAYGVPGLPTLPPDELQAWGFQDSASGSGMC